MNGPVRLSAIVGLIAASACTSVDLRMDGLEVRPEIAAPGDVLDVSATLANSGGSAIPGPKANGAPATLEFVIRHPSNRSTEASLGRVTFGTDDPLRAGERRRISRFALTPETLAAGPYSLCAEADPIDAIEESNERNNIRCVPISVLARPSLRADLSIDTLRMGPVEQGSQKVFIRIRNEGRAETARPFQLMAFTAENRRPLLLTLAPRSLANRACNEPLIGSCQDVWQTDSLKPGQTSDIEAYVTAPVGPNGEFEWNLLRPDPRNPRQALLDVEFFVDACFNPGAPPRDQLPSWCRIDESDERNNYAGGRVRVPR